MCTANEPGKVLTDLMGAEWLGNLTSGKVRAPLTHSLLQASQNHVQHACAGSTCYSR